MRKVLKFLKWTGITLGVLLALFVGINAFDETLDPGAAAILNAQATIKPEENAYFFVVGLRAPLDRTPGEFGQECVARLISVSKNYKEMMALISSGNTGCTHQKSWLAGQDISAISCSHQKESCLSYYQKQSDIFKQLAKKNSVMLQRYEQLLGMEQYEDVPYDISQLPLPLPYDAISELYSAVSAIKIQEGEVGFFIQRTAAEAKFYRLILRSNSGFISKFVALSNIKRAANLASAAVRANPVLAGDYQAALLEISQPLTVAERSLESAMEAELKRVASTVAFLDSAEEASLLERLRIQFSLKPNATLNHLYRGLPGWRDLSRIPTEQYLGVEKAALDRLTNPWHDGYLGLIHNPLGKTLLGIGSPSYGDYPRRIIDEDGRLRLISLQIQLSAQQIPEAGIPAFLKRAASQFRDPYTGQPMQWDKTRGLHFKGYGKGTQGQDGFISVKL